MHSPIGKVIASALVGGLSYAIHAYAPPAVDLALQSLLLQLALHFGITYGRPDPESAK